MQNITDRTNFFSKVKVGSHVERDLGSFSFGDFDFGKDELYLCSEGDIGRPDVISKKIYNSSNFWWFLMWYNGISDVWNDIRPEMVIRYPSLNLVKEAMKKYIKSGDIK